MFATENVSVLAKRHLFTVYYKSHYSSCKINCNCIFWNVWRFFWLVCYVPGAFRILKHWKIFKYVSKYAQRKFFNHAENAKNFWVKPVICQRTTRKKKKVRGKKSQRVLALLCTSLLLTSNSVSKPIMGRECIYDKLSPEFWHICDYGGRTTVD